MTEAADCVVIGAGVIGLGVARALARDGREVIVLEASNAIGSGTSSRNSEVIHAGLYYAPGSAKARFCEAGRHSLYQYCAARGIPHRRTGKLVVASTDHEIGILESIAERARANGATDIELLDGQTTKELEPALNASAALLSPSTGIIDSHAYMLSLQADAEANGALFAFRTTVTGGTVGDGWTRLAIETGDEPMTLRARTVVNACGLTAHRLAASIEGLPAHVIPTIRYMKGNYFALSGKAPFSRLIYPVPEPGGLGVHLTLDMGGAARFGPDTEPVVSIDYHVDPCRSERFYGAIRRYWPDLQDGALHADYAGLRTQIVGNTPSDFLIESSTEGFINLFGIESPGLTASLAIADHVALLCE